MTSSHDSPSSVSSSAASVNLFGQATFGCILGFSSEPTALLLITPMFGFFMGGLGVLMTLLVQEAFGIRFFGSGELKEVEADSGCMAFDEPVVGENLQNMKLSEFGKDKARHARFQAAVAEARAFRGGESAAPSSRASLISAWARRRSSPSGRPRKATSGAGWPPSARASAVAEASVSPAGTGPVEVAAASAATSSPVVFSRTSFPGVPALPTTTSRSVTLALVTGSASGERLPRGPHSGPPDVEA